MSGARRAPDGARRARQSAACASEINRHDATGAKAERITLAALGAHPCASGTPWLSKQHVLHGLCPVKRTALPPCVAPCGSSSRTAPGNTVVPVCCAGLRMRRAKRAALPWRAWRRGGSSAPSMGPWASKRRFEPWSRSADPSLGVHGAVAVHPAACRDLSGAAPGCAGVTPRRPARAYHRRDRASPAARDRSARRAHGC